MAGLGFRWRSAAAERGEKAIERGEKAMTRAMRTTLAILVALVLLAAFGAFYVLEEGEQAVILQFGRPVGAPATEAGLHFKVPFIQEVRRFDKRLLIWDGAPNQIPTAGREFIWGGTTARGGLFGPLKIF